MGHLEVVVGVVVVADEAEAVRADRHRGVLADVARAVERGRGWRLVQVGVRAVGHLEVAVGGVVVADEAEAVGADRDRGVPADVARAVERGEGGARAGGVRAVGHLEVAVGDVVVADEAEAVRADRHGGVLADVARAVERA